MFYLSVIKPKMPSYDTKEVCRFIEGLLVRFYITADDPGSPNSMWVMEFEPSGFAKKHSHKEEHYLYVLEGICELRSKDGSTSTAEAGDSIFVPACEEHEIVNSGDSVLRMLSLMPILKGATGRSTTPCD